MDQITKGVTQMKKVLAAIGKALAYFAVYLLASNVATFIISAIYGYFKGREYGAAGYSYEESQALYQNDVVAMTGIFLMAGALLTLLTYFIIEKVKKSSLAKEADIKKVSGKQLGLTVVGALGGMFFMNFMLSILPIPAELMGGLSSGMSKLTSYPFWQAILANALLVPIMEEVVFRGYIFNRLEKGMPTIVAALISSVAFGIVHGGIVWGTWAFFLGIIICVVRIKSGSIVPGIIFHIIMNTFAMIVSYFPVLDKLSTAGVYILTAVGGILVAVYVAGILMDKKALTADSEKTEVVVTSSKS